MNQPWPFIPRLMHEPDPTKAHSSGHGTSQHPGRIKCRSFREITSMQHSSRPFSLTSTLVPSSLVATQIKGLFLQQGMAEDSILQMRVPKHYRTDSNTGIAYLNVKDEEAFQQALTVKGSYVNNRRDDAPFSFLHGIRICHIMSKNTKKNCRWFDLSWSSRCGGIFSAH